MERTCPVVQYKVNYRGEKGHWNSTTVNGNTTSYTLHLECWKQYEITVTSFYSYNQSDKEDSKIWNFKTGTKGKGLFVLNVGFRATKGVPMGIQYPLLDDVL